MPSIFYDGDIVENLVMPKEIFNGSIRERKRWAAEALTDYIVQKHGKRFSCSVSESLSHNGKVTGTQGNIRLQDKEITYMLVEPNNSRGEIHIVKKEKNISEEANAYDFLEYQTKQSEQLQGFKNNPFGKLAGLLLPK